MIIDNRRQTRLDAIADSRYRAKLLQQKAGERLVLPRRRQGDLKQCCESLSRDHRDFIAAGELGVLIGDGALNYRRERILETYYAFALSKALTLTAARCMFSRCVSRRVLMSGGNYDAPSRSILKYGY